MKKALLTSASVFTMLAFCISTAIAQVTVTETIEHGGTVTTKKVITETETVPVIVAPATIETVTTTRSLPVDAIVETRAVIPVAGPRVYTILDFDVNHDAMLSLDDVGVKLFDIYDTDGNDVIDNIEFERRAVLTVTPVQQKTTVAYDFDGDGRADQVATTMEVFQQRTGLAAFDRNGDGLSAREFTGRHFNEADINNDHAIDLKEWQGSYIAYIDHKNKEKARFN